MSDSTKSGQHYNMRLSLTTEGWIYLVILSFVSVCAVLRNVNLLIVFTGVMMAAIFLGWRLGRSLVRSLVAKRLLQSRVHAGQLVNVQWQVSNHSLLPGWYINVFHKVSNLHSRRISSDSASGSERNSPKTERKTSRKEKKVRVANSNLVFDYIPGGESAYMSYRALFTHRGTYELGPVSVSSMFPMGLVKNWFQITDTELLYVAPRLGRLSPDWEQRISSLAFGSQSARRKRGPDPDEFYAIRSWRSGDNLRDIHWRTTAKYQSPMVKQFDQKSNRDFALVLDLFEPELQQAVDVASQGSETVLSFAATILSQISSMARGRIVFSSAASEATTFSSASHSDFLASVMKYLASVDSSRNPQLAAAIKMASSHVSPGTPVIVVSPRSLSESWLQTELGSDLWSRIRNRIRPLSIDSIEFQQLFKIDDPYFEGAIGELRRDLPKEYPARNVASETNKEAQHVSA